MYMFTLMFFLICIVSSVYSADDYEIDFPSVLHDSAIQFVQRFFKKQSNDTCTDLNSYSTNIFEYSFSMDNFLGDYMECVKNDTMSYLYFLFINLDAMTVCTEDCDIFTNNTYNLSYYFKDLVFYEYYTFAMCIPKCFHIQYDEPVVNPFNIREDKDREYYVKIINTGEKSVQYGLTAGNSSVVISYIFFAAFFICLFFSLLPSSQSYSCKRKKKVNDDDSEVSEEYNFHEIKQIIKMNKDEEKVNNNFDVHSIKSSNEIDQDNTIQMYESNKEVGYRWAQFYKLLNSIFNLIKNYKRLFKSTHKKLKINSSYINDNSVAFINGLKSINLFCLCYCSIFWIFLESPNSNSGYKPKSKIFSYGGILSVLYYLYTSIYLIYLYDGFLLGYKFLCHMHNKFNLENTKTTTTKKFLTFFLPQIYKYPVYIFLFFVVYNLDNLFNIISNKEGPLSYLYNEISQITSESFLSFLFLFSNFTKLNERKITKNSIYVFFFVFVNEMQYFLIMLVILLILYKKNNLGYFLLIMSYFITAISRAIYSNCSRAGSVYGDIRDLFGFEIYSYQFFNGFPVYILGVILGALYYDYNADENITLSLYQSMDTSMVSYSEYMSMQIGNKGREFIKYLARSKKLQIILFTVVITLLTFFIVWDFVFLFPRIKNEFLSKFSVFEMVYAFLEVDLFGLLIFLTVFKFAIFNNTPFKKFLEMSLWIPLSRLYFNFACFLSPITYFFILNLDYPIVFSYSTIMFLSVSILLLLYLMCYLVELFIGIPLKVGFKKTVKTILI